MIACHIDDNTHLVLIILHVTIHQNLYIWELFQFFLPSISTALMIRISDRNCFFGVYMLLPSQKLSPAKQIRVARYFSGAFSSCIGVTSHERQGVSHHKQHDHLFKSGSYSVGIARKHIYARILSSCLWQPTVEGQFVMRQFHLVNWHFSPNGFSHCREIDLCCLSGPEVANYIETGWNQIIL